MKTLSCLFLAATLGTAFCGIVGCETQHSESTKPTWTGGEKHEETTTTKNPITGETNTTHNEQKTQ